MVTFRSPSTSGLLEPSAPQWAQRMLLRLVNFFMPQVPTMPMALIAITKANLPPPADWLGCMVYVGDIKKVAVSNGSAWTDPTGGAI